MTAAQGAFLHITEQVKTSALQVFFDLFHAGRLTVGGREIRLERPVLPEIVRVDDHLELRFPSPIKVQTPGPDSRISVVKVWRNRIEFSVWPWANVVVECEP
jgi:hypothetical protein